MKVGIDPGLHGALALLKDNAQLVTVLDMPVMARGKGKREQVNAAELAKILSPWRQGHVGTEYITAYLERAASMPKQGVASMFSFGVSYGMALGVLAALGIPVVLVAPATWKGAAGLSKKPKDAARTLAQQLYPDASLGRKKDCGRADAILIARFGG